LTHHKHSTFGSAIALLCALVLGSAWLAPVALAQTPTATATGIATCPTGLAITVAPPAAGSTTVSATITPTLNIKAAALGDLQSFHVHYFIDVDPTKTLKAGSVIPSGDPKIIHSGTTTQDLGTLAAGSHTVWVVVGQVAHQACGGTDGNVIAGSTTFTVAAVAATTTAAPAPTRTGNGGLAQPQTGLAMPLALLTAALVTTLAARSLTGRRHR